MPSAHPAPLAIRVSAQALEHSQLVTSHLREQIARAGGWLSFHAWMHDALYAPGLGYYTAGATKLAIRDDQPASPATQGDFVTAPELSPVFGYTIARALVDPLRTLTTVKTATTLPPPPVVLEMGAGSGQLAHDVLSALQRLGISVSYQILEVSADLRSRQQQKLAAWGDQVRWINDFPRDFDGVVLANEVLDAMPVHLVGWDTDARVFERGVVWKNDAFAWEDRSASANIASVLRARMPFLPGYITELNLAAEAWISMMGTRMARGLVLLIDYGFPAKEYFHPQRHQGTLMCHIQHRAHHDPLFAPGLQDITAHVDFSAMASAATTHGFDVLGYTSQARFLLNAGLPDEMTGTSRMDLRAIEKLISEAEMGELFKVLALGKHFAAPLEAFKQGDRRHQL
jgi:SAM-dependent MidA family methyltransferase